MSNFVSVELKLKLINTFLSQEVFATSNHCVLRKILNLEHFTLSNLLQELHQPQLSCLSDPAFKSHAITK